MTGIVKKFNSKQLTGKTELESVRKDLEAVRLTQKLILGVIQDKSKDEKLDTLQEQLLMEQCYGLHQNMVKHKKESWDKINSVFMVLEQMLQSQKVLPDAILKELSLLKELLKPLR